MSASPFWTVHRDLPREGPGEAADVAWAADVAGLPMDARIADVACGPGADVAAWLTAAPEGHVTAIDKTAHFVEAVRAAYGDDPRVTPVRGDMAALTGPYDLIWCAGAVYFMGVGPALTAWRAALAPGGVVAFSEPCLFADPPSAQALAFWEGDPVDTPEGIAARIASAGYETLATRRVSDAAWDAYYVPMKLRIAMLREGADAALNAALDQAQAEAEAWASVKGETGYLLSVVRPV